MVRSASELHFRQLGSLVRWLAQIFPEQIELEPSIWSSGLGYSAPLEQEREAKFYEFLRDGTILCRLATQLDPQLGSLKYNKTPKIAAARMENIQLFCRICSQQWKLQTAFTSIDLHDRANIPLAVLCLCELGESFTKRGFQPPMDITSKLLDGKRLSADQVPLTPPPASTTPRRQRASSELFEKEVAVPLKTSGSAVPALNLQGDTAQKPRRLTDPRTTLDSPMSRRAQINPKSDKKAPQIVVQSTTDDEDDDADTDDDDDDIYDESDDSSEDDSLPPMTSRLHQLYRELEEVTESVATTTDQSTGPPVEQIDTPDTTDTPDSPDTPVEATAPEEEKEIVAEAPADGDTVSVDEEDAAKPAQWERTQADRSQAPLVQRILRRKKATTDALIVSSESREDLTLSDNEEPSLSVSERIDAAVEESSRRHDSPMDDDDDWEVPLDAETVPVERFLALRDRYRELQNVLRQQQEESRLAPHKSSRRKRLGKSREIDRHHTAPTVSPTTPVKEKNNKGSLIRRGAASIVSNSDRKKEKSGVKRDPEVEERKEQYRRVTALKEERRKEKDLARLGSLTDKRQVQRMNVLLEILHTERAYLNNLQLLIRSKDFLLEAKAINETEALGIFSNVEELFSLHQGIATMLDARFLDAGDTDCWNVCIGDMLLGLADSLRIYSPYVENRPKQGHVVETCCERKNFASTLYRNVAEFSDADLVLVHLNSYLISPIQRMCKYPLLIRELIRHTDESHPDFVTLQSALQRTEEATMGVNQSKREFEAMSKIEENLDNLPRSFQLLVPDRVLVREGFLFKFSNGRLQERYFYLCNDIIIYGSRHTLRTRIQYKGRMTLADSTLVILKDTEQLQNGFELIQMDLKKKKYVLFAKTAQEGQAWLDDLQTKTAVSVQGPTAPSDSLRSEKSEMNQLMYKQLAITKEKIQKFREMTATVPEAEKADHLLKVEMYEQQLRDLEEELENDN